MYGCNRYRGYDATVINGYDAMNAITAYSDDIQIYVSPEYDTVSQTFKAEDHFYWPVPPLEQASPKDADTLQALYKKDSSFCAFLVYDGDTPRILYDDLAITSPLSAEELIKKYEEVRSLGATVSGILLVPLQVTSDDK